MNLALDRREIVRAAGASSRWFTPTDQIVPSWIPGWKNYRIYPLKGPDLVRARKFAKGHRRDREAVLYEIAHHGNRSFLENLDELIGPSQ